MKSRLFTLLAAVLVLALAAPLSLSADPAPEPTVEAVDDAGWIAEEVDIEGMGDEEFADWLGQANLDVTPPAATATQPPACPTTVQCTSPTGPCAIGLNCTVTTLGPCCTSGGGPVLCCIIGQIRVKTCPCAGVGCPSQQVTWRCR